MFLMELKENRLQLVSLNHITLAQQFYVPGLLIQYAVIIKSFSFYK